MNSRETFLQTSNWYARIGQPAAQRQCFVAGAVHFKAAKPAEKDIGHVLFRKYASSRHRGQPRS